MVNLLGLVGNAEDVVDLTKDTTPCEPSYKMETIKKEGDDEI